MPLRRWLLVAALALCISGNYAILRFRKHGFTELPASCNSLYFCSETPAISNLISDGNKLTVVLDRAISETWTVNSGPDSHESRGANPTVRLVEGLRNYRVSPADGRPGFELSIHFVPSSTYLESGRKAGNTIDILRSSIPMGSFPRHDIESFCNYNLLWRPEDAEEARRILAAAKVPDGGSSLQKMEAISAFVSRSLRPFSGTPARGFDKLPPLEQFKRAKDGKGKIWCSNFAQIYVFFANAAGIRTRMVLAGGQFGQAEASLSGHAFAETYLEEMGIWAFTDPASGIIRVEDPSGTPLNTIQLFFLALSGSKGQDLRQTRASENAISSNPFDLAANSIGHYFRRDTIFSFPSFKHLWLPEKYRKLASPDLTFSLQPKKSLKHLKTISFLSTAVLSVLLSADILLRRRRKTAKPDTSDGTGGI